MKEFIKWLENNEKISKVIVILLLLTIILIILNTTLMSLGLPYYKITNENLINKNTNMTIEFIVASVISVLSFYSIVLLVFKFKEKKRIFKYAILYLILNIAITFAFSNIITQVFIVLYIIIFCYLYSKRNKKYLIYGLLAYIFTSMIQGIWYITKAKFIDYDTINEVTKSILSLDYFIIMTIIIFTKEIFIKKRGEKANATMPTMDRRIQK